MIVRGVDVSRAQPPTACDWPRAFDAGVRFCFVKGSEGMRDAAPFVDEAAAAHLAALKCTPIFRGMYHLARPDRRFAESKDARRNGRVEGEFAAETAIALGVAGPGSFPVVLDLEKYTPASLGITDEQRDEMVRAMVDTVDAWLGRLPIVYTGQDFWASQHTTAFAEELRERGVLLWQVDYRRGVEPGEAIKGWPWSMWQHSGGGDFAYAPAIPGLPMPIDQNIYRGTLAELRGLVRSGC